MIAMALPSLQSGFLFTLDSLFLRPCLTAESIPHAAHHLKWILVASTGCWNTGKGRCCLLQPPTLSCSKGIEKCRKSSSRLETRHAVNLRRMNTALLECQWEGTTVQS